MVLEVKFSEFLNRYRASGMDSEGGWFSIGYRKKDGSWGYKPKVRRLAGKGSTEINEKGDLKSISTAVKRAGTLDFETDKGERFELKALGIMEFNGKKIDHTF